MGKWDQYAVEEAPATNKWAQFETASAQSLTQPRMLDRGATRVEDLIAKRGGGNLGALQQEAANPRMLLLNALGLNPTRPGSQLDLGMKAVGAVGEQVEAPLASAGLAIQQRQPWSQVGSQMLRSVLGQRPAQLGDVIRATGVPGLQSGPIPATIGLLGMAGLTGGLGGTKVAKEVGAMATDLEKTATRPFQQMARQIDFARTPTLEKSNPRLENFLPALRAKILKAPKIAGTEFETSLNEIQKLNPDTRINVSEGVQNALAAQQSNPAFKQMLDRSVRNTQESTLIQRILNQPGAAENLTLTEAQLLKQPIQRALKAKFGQLSPDLFGAHLDMLDLWHSIRAAEVQALPGLEDVFQAYSKVLQNFRDIKPILKKGMLESNTISNFKNNTELITSLRELLPKETIHLITRLQKSSGARTLLKRLGFATAGAAGGYEVYRHVLKPLAQRVLHSS